MKIHIESDELYPVYFELEIPANGYGATLDLPDAEVERFRSACAEWDEVQSLMLRRLRERNAATERGAVIHVPDTP